MNQYEPVPGDVYDAALRVYVRGKSDTAPEAEVCRELVRGWARRRYPERQPDRIEDCAFWVLSVACNYGIAREVLR